ncbi:acetyl-coenzyme A synthetase [Singulisphaera sp. GP187]|uniref:acetate--CoA ligase n=1 Tax=Singulisphaera sp. GP187 TaxID=1882752 RepID=UPI00092C4C47|nr:acetate--CoA ligase [Singulisphaera sp. GP187]SIO61941.1 acetyl-coenzyme A synthetase [Singulisphaera sp. GP187]
MSAENGGSIVSILTENRVFPPPSEFAAKAHISSLEQYESLWNRAKDDPAGFWGEMAQTLEWSKPWDQVLDWNPPFAKWFVGGELNASVNCVDRHCAGPNKDKAAIIWEGEPGEKRVLTYQDLLREVSQFANVLKGLGVRKGDVVAIYMPMIPELVIALLACARIGAPHTVVFGGFSAEALAGRVQDCQAKVLVTADGGFRRGKVVPLKDNADGAAAVCPSLEAVVVCKRTGHEIAMTAGRDHWWHELAAKASTECPPESLDSEHPLYILYTSGSTGKPKGILHTTGGYLLGAALTTKWVFDLKDDDVYFCTADVGWVTGHTYLVYGPLANGASCVMYEGAPNWPDEGRFWKIIQENKVSILYTAPTAIRAFMKWGEQFPKSYDLSSLRLLGSVGEPINPEAWMWYHRVIGGERCPIVDTWWQTETGSIMIAPLPGATPTVPGSATRPLPGIVPEVVTRDGNPVGANEGGFLVIKQPWPAMLRTLYGDDERYQSTYWSEVPGCYFTGDGARRDAQGNFWIMGRVDDVLNVAGHRLSTMEVESALVSHPKVAEAAVVGKPDELRGQAISAFVTLETGQEATEALRQELRAHVVKEIGALARPDDIRFTESLPKTRSGKIMRRLLRDVAAGRESTGDTSTLEDLSVLAKLKEEDEV